MSHNGVSFVEARNLRPKGNPKETPPYLEGCPRRDTPVDWIRVSPDLPHAAHLRNQATTTKLTRTAGAFLPVLGAQR